MTVKLRHRFKSGIGHLSSFQRETLGAGWESGIPRLIDEPKKNAKQKLTIQNQLILT